MATYILGRQLKVIIVSASNLPDVRKFGSSRVYAEVSLNERAELTKRTKPDNEGENNPVWNTAGYYPLSEAVVRHPGVNLVVNLFCERTLGDKFVGKVVLPIKYLFDEAEGTGQTRLCCPVTGFDGTKEGRLIISYSFGDTVVFDPDADADVPAPTTSDSTHKNVLKVLRLGLELAGLSVGN